jgi:hypothetical protein
MSVQGHYRRFGRRRCMSALTLKASKRAIRKNGGGHMHGFYLCEFIQFICQMLSRALESKTQARSVQ